MPNGGIHLLFYFFKSGINFLLNDNFIYYVYSYHINRINCFVEIRSKRGWSLGRNEGAHNVMPFSSQSELAKILECIEIRCHVNFKSVEKEIIEIIFLSATSCILMHSK